MKKFFTIVLVVGSLPLIFAQEALLGKNEKLKEGSTDSNTNNAIFEKTTIENDNLKNNTTMNDYILLLREDFDQMQKLSTEEMQKLVQEHMDWVEKLSASGNFKAGDGLNPDGAVIKGKDRVVLDGPYMEAREGIGGYYIIQANDLKEAIEIAKNCPTLKHDGHVEVRPIMIY